VGLDKPLTAAQYADLAADAVGSGVQRQSGTRTEVFLRVNRASGKNGGAGVLRGFVTPSGMSSLHAIEMLPMELRW
jgi:hypothetical protein